MEHERFTLRQLLHLKRNHNDQLPKVAIDDRPSGPMQPMAEETIIPSKVEGDKDERRQLHSQSLKLHPIRHASTDIELGHINKRSCDSSSPEADLQEGRNYLLEDGRECANLL